MLQMIRTDASHPDFIQLVKLLDAYLAIVDGEDHGFYDTYNQLESIRYVIIVYENNAPVGCGAIKPWGENAMEIKRMFTHPEHRGKGIATRILTELECWAKELSARKCLLETGKKQTEAVALYYKNGYSVIPNYGQYAGIDNSICFEKIVVYEDPT